MSYITINEAAYLMGHSVETIQKMIDNKELLCLKGRAGELLIHESEMQRFQHPWKHIFRLDQRINAQQVLVETLKGKIAEPNSIYERDTETKVNDALYAIEQLCKTIDQLECRIQEIQKVSQQIPALRETIDGMLKAQKTPKRKKR